MFNHSLHNDVTPLYFPLCFISLSEYKIHKRLLNLIVSHIDVLFKGLYLFLFYMF